MCGIAALVAKADLTDHEIDAFIDAAQLMKHRGPDHTGVYRSANVILVHHRLSIIDLDPRSNQPFISRSGKSICTYNGEVYNFKDLRTAFPFEWRTNSDTEVLLESFERFGMDAVRNWNGIFAGIVLQGNDLFIFRDRFGIKPLYRFETERFILFASEAKCILKFLPEFKLNFRALNKYLWFGNTTGSETCIDGMTKVPPASISRLNLTNFKTEDSVYWRADTIQKRQIRETDAVEELRFHLANAVKRQLVSDAPLGVLLSGGVDSSGLVAFAAQNSSRHLVTISVEYDQNSRAASELPLAARVAKRYGTKHREIRVTSQNVPEIFRNLVFQFDEPFADSANIPLFQLAKACSADKRVILQGDGGDELFGGYDRYKIVKHFLFWKWASKFYFLLSGRNRERMKRLHHILSQSTNQKIIANYLTVETPQKNPYSVFSAETAAKLTAFDWQSDHESIDFPNDCKSLIDQLLFSDFKILLTDRYLEKVDKATMLASVEARVPYLDNDLAEFALSLPSNLKVKRGVSKYILKRTLEGFVPNEVLYGSKRGFEVPYREWLRSDLFDFACDSFRSAPQSFFDSNRLIELLELHRTHAADYGDLLWKCLVLIEWLSVYKTKLVNQA
jgi:asparagine synthase (glutamine-hydrolysing)